MSRRRGAALLEFAVALPFALILFVGIGDFSVYFWRQTEMEEIARGLHQAIFASADSYASAAGSQLETLAHSLETDVRRRTGTPDLTVQLSRHYACPQAEGAENELSAVSRPCAGERIYLRVQAEKPAAPMLTPLRRLGYPTAAFSRHVLRLR